MIVVKAQMTVAPQARAGFLQAMRALTEAAQADAGCVSFICCEDVSAPNHLLVLQEWEDAAAFDQHEASGYLAQFKAQVAGMSVSWQPTRVYSVSRVGGL